MSNHIKKIRLSEQERDQLERIVRKASSPQNLVLRSNIVLMTAEKIPVNKICRELHTTRATVRKWKQRFVARGLSGLRDINRPGHPVKYNTHIRMKIASTACNPPDDVERWTIRKLAKHLDLNRGIVQRVLKEHSLRLS